MSISFIPKSGLSLVLLGSTCFVANAGNPDKKDARPNVLFIAVDDLKPLFSAYGDRFAKTPGLDRLAREGVSFKTVIANRLSVEPPEQVY